MSLLSNIIINSYSILILLIICINSLRIFEKTSLQDQIYMMILYAAIVMLVLDVLSRLDGNAQAYYPLLNTIGNFLIFALNPVLASLWLAYVHLYVFNNEKQTRKLIYFLSLVNIINVVIVIISMPYGWFYTIDANNVYHRGEFYLLSILITVLLLFVAFLIIVLNRKNLNRKSFLSLLFFAFPPAISIILQVKFYGISLMLNSVVFSILVLFLNIQNHGMFTDHLTKISNRKKLDAYLGRKIRLSSLGNGFSAILLDIDGFKNINDTYGHNVGDEALESAANLLKSCLRENDFIARYGGDEFCIILDVSNNRDLEAMVSRINSSVEAYNKTKSNTFDLSFSMGYAVYDKDIYRGADDFLSAIDTLMYQQKQAKSTSNK